MENQMDIRKIYMTKRAPNHPRIGAEYQAIIPSVNPKYAKKEEEKTKKEESKKMPSLKNMGLKELNESHKAHHDYDQTIKKVEEDVDQYE
ncbi:MAG: hypothetical protein MJ252_15955, partial [archaeon]|nr:hypothetical protein [archaeon]